MGIDMNTAVRQKERPVTDEIRLSIVTHLAAAKPIVEVAGLLGLHRTQVESVGSMYGHPQLQRLERSRVVLAAVVETPAPAQVPGPVVVAEPTRSRSEATQERVNYQATVLARHGATRAEVAVWANNRGYSIGRSGLLPRIVLNEYEASRG